MKLKIENNKYVLYFNPYNEINNSIGYVEWKISEYPEYIHIRLYRNDLGQIVGLRTASEKDGSSIRKTYYI